MKLRKLKDENKNLKFAVKALTTAVKEVTDTSAALREDYFLLLEQNKQLNNKLKPLQND